MQDFLDKIIPEVCRWAGNGIVASLGTIAHYLYLVERNRDTLRFFSFVINISMGLFIGNVIANLKVSDDYVIAAMMIGGFLVYEIFDVLENSGADIIVKILYRFGLIDKKE